MRTLISLISIALLAGTLGVGCQMADGPDVDTAEQAMTSRDMDEVAEGMATLVDTKFGGDWDRAFVYLANRSTTDNTINREELLWALKQAGIGNWMTRGAWADGIIKELDKSGDRTISEREFNSVFRLDKGTSDKF